MSFEHACSPVGVCVRTGSVGCLWGDPGRMSWNNGALSVAQSGKSEFLALTLLSASVVGSTRRKEEIRG